MIGHRVRSAFRALFATVVALVLLMGIARSGGRYFFCPAMGVAMADACCVRTHAPEGEPYLPSVETPDCCEAHRLGTLPNAATPASVDVAHAPLASVLPPYTFAPVVRAPVVHVTDAREARAGPSPSRHRASLMIWNC